MREEQKNYKPQKKNQSKSQTLKQRQNNIILTTFGSQAYYQTSAKKIEWFGFKKKNISIGLFQKQNAICIGLQVDEQGEPVKKEAQEHNFSKWMQFQKIRHIKKHQSTLEIMFDELRQEGSWKIYFQAKEIAQRWYDLLWLQMFYFNKEKKITRKVPKRLVVDQNFHFEENQELKHTSVSKQFQSEQPSSQNHRLQIFKQIVSFGTHYFTIVNFIQQKHPNLCFLGLLQINRSLFFGYAQHVCEKKPIFYNLWPIHQVRFIHQYQQQNKLLVQIDRGIDLCKITFEFYNKAILQKWLFLMLSLRQIPDKDIDIQRILSDFTQQTQFIQTDNHESRKQLIFNLEQDQKSKEKEKFDTLSQKNISNSKDEKYIDNQEQIKSQYRYNKKLEFVSSPTSSVLKKSSECSEQKVCVQEEQTNNSKQSENARLQQQNLKLKSQISELQSMKIEKDELNKKYCQLKDRVAILECRQIANNKSIKELQQINEKHLDIESKNQFYNQKQLQNYNKSQQQIFKLKAQCSSQENTIRQLQDKMQKSTKQLQQRNTELKIAKHAEKELCSIQELNLMKQNLKEGQLKLKSLEYMVQSTKFKQEQLREQNIRYFKQRQQKSYMLGCLRQQLQNLAQQVKKIITSWSLQNTFIQNYSAFSESFQNILQDLNSSLNLNHNLSADQAIKPLQDFISSSQSKLSEVNLSNINEACVASMNTSINFMLHLMRYKSQDEQAEKRQSHIYSSFYDEAKKDYSKISINLSI